MCNVSEVVFATIIKYYRIIRCAIMEWISNVSETFLLHHQGIITQEDAYKSILTADVWEFAFIVVVLV
jgi:hypothetical protein